MYRVLEFRLPDRIYYPEPFDFSQDRLAEGIRESGRRFVLPALQSPELIEGDVA